MAAEIYRERVMRARALSPQERLEAGPRLFDYACELARAGIRQQFPALDKDGVRKELDRRLALQAKLER